MGLRVPLRMKAPVSPRVHQVAIRKKLGVSEQTLPLLGSLRSTLDLFGGLCWWQIGVAGVDRSRHLVDRSRRHPTARRGQRLRPAAVVPSTDRPARRQTWAPVFGVQRCRPGEAYRHLLRLSSEYYLRREPAADCDDGGQDDGGEGELQPRRGEGLHGVSGAVLAGAIGRAALLARTSEGARGHTSSPNLLL